MARLTMLDLIARLRTLGNASETDVFNGITYWDNDQLEEILDQYRVYTQIPLESVSVDDTVFKLDAPRHHKLEDDNFTVYDENESVVSTTVTYNLADNHLVFDTALSSTKQYFIEGWVYNIFQAIVELYDIKASHREFYTELKAGNSRLRLEQEYNHCIARRDYYNNKIIRKVDNSRVSRWRS